MAAQAPTSGGAGGGARTSGGGFGNAGTGNTSGTSSTGSSTTGSTARVTQTVTSVIGVGATVGLGQVLYTVDSQPVIALSGVLPAWRTLSTSSDDGPDIQQLENSLVSLGYDPDGDVVVDNEFDSTAYRLAHRVFVDVLREEV